MLGLDVIGATALSFGGSTGSKVDTVADKVASKASTVLAKVPAKAKKIAAFARKAQGRAKNAKAQAAKARATAKQATMKATAKALQAKVQTKAALKATTAMAPKAPMQTIAPQAPVRTATVAPVAARAPAVQTTVVPSRTAVPTVTRTMTMLRGIGLDMVATPSMEATLDVTAERQVVEQLTAEMIAYGDKLDDASRIVSLLEQLAQLLPVVQAAGATDLYNQGVALEGEANLYDPDNPTDLAARGARWISAARNVGPPSVSPTATTETPPTETAPAEGSYAEGGYGGGGDYGGGGGGGGFGGGAAGGGDDAEALEEQAQAESQGGDSAFDEESFDPEGVADEEAAEIEEGFDESEAEEELLEEEGSYEYNEDDQVVGLRGLDILGASRSPFIGEAKRQGTARDFGILDMAYACIVGAHLAANQKLTDYAKQLSGQILAQVSPPFTADGFRQKLEALAGDIQKITNRNPLDEVYEGPTFEQTQNDYFSGDVVSTATHFSQESGATIAKKMADAASGLGSFLTALKWIGIVGAAGLVVVLAVVAGSYAKKKSA